MSETTAGVLGRALPPLFWAFISAWGSGCIADPEVAGKVTVSRDGEELVIDTGGNGTKAVDVSDDVSGMCIVRKQGELSVTVAKDGEALSFFDVMHQADSPHASARIDGELYQGACEIIVQEQQGDPYEADVAAGPCDLVRLFDGAKARLETAVFHVSDCSGAE
ncbi:hypothetical protein [Sorangium sp. So ce1078]|uniref:hypothetical protein n=1 Tax=Sorangium sp. So ce1078 TaxID=3133329 RepID=UPI003F6148F9